MDTPQEGRSGGREPQSLPGDPSHPSGDAPGKPLRGRERQTLLPGLDDLDPGWTVFGPAEEPGESTEPDEAPEPDESPGPGDPTRREDPQQVDSTQQPDEPAEPLESELSTGEVATSQGASDEVSPVHPTNGVAPPPPEPAAILPAADLVEDALSPPGLPPAEGSASEAPLELEPPAPVAATEPEPVVEPAEPLPAASEESSDGALDPPRAAFSPQGPTARRGLPWPWAIVLAAALLTALGGVIAAHLSGDPGSAQLADPGGSEAAPLAAVPTARVEELEHEIETLRTQLEEASQEMDRADGLRSELEGTRVSVAQRLAMLEQDLADVRSRLVERDAELESERFAREPVEQTFAAQRTSAGAPASASSAKPTPIEATAPRREPEALAQPQEQALRRAAGLDRILADIEGGQAARARSRLAGLIEAGILAGDDAGASALLGGLVGGWEALERAGITGSGGTSTLDAPALREARAGLDQARQHLTGFAEKPASWLGLGESDGSPLHRLERLDRAVEGLEQRLASALGELELQHERDWEWMLGLGLPQDPAHAERHVERFACGHDSELTELCAQALLAACVREGDVDPEALSRAQHLESWGRRALARTTPERSPADLDLLWLWYAKRWYVDAEAYDALDWEGLAMPEVLETHEDWRAELRLETALSEPGSGWPPPPGSRAVYLVHAETPARWRIDERAGEPGSDGAVQLTRTHLDADGEPLGGPVEVELEHEGRRFRYAGSGGVLLDLAAWGLSVAASPAPELASDEPPAASGASARDAAQLREQLEGELCLVHRDGEWTRWFAPGVGLLREERTGPEGTVVIQLVALTPAR